MWVSPPSFADGNYLSAAQLNTLSNDVAHVWAAVQQPAIPLERKTFTSDATYTWGVRHKHRYLYYNINLESGTHDSIEVFYNHVQLYIDGTNRSAPYTWAGTIDLSAQGLTVNNFYEVSVRYYQAGASICHVNCLWEQPS